MMHITKLRPAFVEFIPEHLEQGVIYISKRYATAAHLCCCGCGLEVITPLNPAKWRLIEKGGTVSLRPSVGNWSFPCQSHYWIDGNCVRWAGAMTPEVIAAIKVLDRLDADVFTSSPKGWGARLGQSARNAISWLAGKLGGWWRK